MKSWHDTLAKPTPKEKMRPTYEDIFVCYSTVQGLKAIKIQYIILKENLFNHIFISMMQS